MLWGPIAFVGAVLVAFLPPRYRRRFYRDVSGENHKAAFVSGFVQLVASIFFLVARAISFFAIPPDVDIVKAAFDRKFGGASIPGSGVFALANFFLQPIHVFATYLMLEGIVRMFSAAISEQTVGTLPLYIVSAIHNWLEPKWQERRAGPRILDEVQPGDGTTHELRILSCRARPDWHRNITIRYRDEFYQMFKEEAGPAPRPFIYYLRKPPLGHLVVAIRDYEPTDVLKG